MKNNLWKQLIKQKIINQVECLLINGKIDGHKKLLNISNKVKSGYKENCEGYAAREYYKNLFGDNFIKNRNKNDINILLNYGYKIARSMVARNLISSGLNPMIGVFHTNDLNPMLLVDDILNAYVQLLIMKFLN